MSVSLRLWGPGVPGSPENLTAGQARESGGLAYSPVASSG